MRTRCRTLKSSAVLPCGARRMACCPVDADAGGGNPQVSSPPAKSPAGHPDTLFLTSHDCCACHNGLTTPTGEDVSIGVSWRASMMANSSRDPYWQAAVRREIIDHPGGGRGDRGRMRDLPHADVANEGTRGEPAGPDLRAPADRHRRGRRRSTRRRRRVVHGLPPDWTRAPRHARELQRRLRAERSRRPSAERRMFGPVRGRRRPPGDHALGDGHDAGGGDAPPRIGSVRHVPHAVSRKRSARRARWSASCPSRCRTSSGATAHSSRNGAASRATCRRSRSRRESPRSWARSAIGLGRHTFLGGNFFMLRMLNRYRADLGRGGAAAGARGGSAATIAQLQRDTATARVASAPVECGRPARPSTSRCET